MKGAHAVPLRGFSRHILFVVRGSHSPSAAAAPAAGLAAPPTLYTYGRGLTACVNGSTVVRGLCNGGSRRTSLTRSAVGWRRLSYRADAAVAQNLSENSEGGRPKIQSISDLLEQDDPLSGLFDAYNNENSMRWRLARPQMERRAERGVRIEMERAERKGLSYTAGRQFAYKGFCPSLAFRIPFEDDVIILRHQTTNQQLKSSSHNECATANASATKILQRIPLSQAIKALLADSTALYVDSKRFCDSLEPLVCGWKDVLGGVLPSMDRAKVRGILEDIFARLPTTHSGLADAFDLVLGLCRFCQTTGDERIRTSFALFDKEGQGCLHFLVVAAVFHHLHRMLLTPFVVGMFHRAGVTFKSVDDLAVASAVELFKVKYPHLSNKPQATSKEGFTLATRGTSAAAAAAFASDQLLIDLTEEPWKSAACHAGLFLSYEDFVKVCEATPKAPSMNTQSLLRLPLIITLQDVVGV